MSAPQADPPEIPPPDAWCCLSCGWLLYIFFAAPVILHQVPEGYVGVYFQGGALLKTITDPGFQWQMPFVTDFVAIQVTMRTVQATNIQCVTKEGVMIKFSKIEIVNRLRKEYVYKIILKYGLNYDKILFYEKIHEEINHFCSSHALQQVYIDVFDQIDEMMKDTLQRYCTREALGVEIISVRVAKPIIPASIMDYYGQMEKERAKALIAIEEAKTRGKVAISEAEENAHLSKIIMEQKLAEKESARRQQEIDDEMFLDAAKKIPSNALFRTLRVNSHSSASVIYR